ncbi:MAG: hypothetical protein ABUT20_40435, partial [Bacteroidota bacterium]
ETKVLKVSYSGTNSSVSAIQQAIANSGYDTPGFKATAEAYNSLDECCRYARDAKAKCCDKEAMKDGKCADMADCKDKDCCKKS